jgi:hypothetical protein
MRHHPLQPIRALIFASAFLLVVGQGTLATYAEPPLWNGSPVLGVVRLAPLDRLQQDFAFLADGVGGGEAATAILDALTDLSDGIDPRRPSGAVVYFDETYVPMIFVPLKDQQRLIAVLASRFGWEFRREGDGCYRYKDADSDLDVVARVAGSWMYITGASNRDKLQTVPADPMVLFEGTDPTLTSYAAFYFAQFPAELRSEIIGKIGEATSRSDADSLAREGTAAAEQLVQRLFAETQSLQFELQCFRPLKQFHLAARLDAVEGSWLARWIENASQRKTLFSHLPSRDSIFAFLASVKLDTDVTRQLTQAWQPLAAAAKASMPSPRSRDHAESLLGRFVEQAVDAVTATIRPGELDGGFVVERQGRDQVVLLAGTTLLGARSVEQAATEVAQLLQQSEEFRAMQWRRTVDGEVGIHQVNIPSTDESAQTLLGDPAVLAIGAGNDRVYAAIGGNETSARLSEALERSREDAPDSGEVIRIHARMAPLLSILAAVPGSNAENDAELEKLAAQIAPYRKNDALELSLKAVDRTLEGRLQIDMGIVQMLAVNVPVAGAPSVPQAAGQGAGVLRLQAGDRFQLEFHTKSDVTTKIDGNDRRDRGVHSLTYDFRVDKVAADGTMRIATSLSRATLDKTSPDGRELFDSANPPETEAMTAEMFLLGALVGETFTIAVRSDGTIAEISGLAEAIENVLDAKLQPSAEEREGARAFVAQILNEDQLRDSLTRGFEFYPGKEISDGAGWARTTENLALMKFFLDNRYQTETISPDEVVISVRSQVRKPDADDGQDQPIRWKVAGSQSGTIRLDRRSGRLRLAKYTLRLDAEASFELEGAMVSRPMVSAIEMAIGEPSLVAAEVSRSDPASPKDDRSGNLVDVQVASFTAEQIRTWRAQLGRWAMMPESAPEGWSKSRNDPAKLLTLFPKLKVRQGYVLRAYQFREEGNGNGFVWALPVDAEFPEPDESPRLQGHFLNPPKPFDALDDLMEAIEGDDSPESYLHASILRRQWSEFGAGWHGIDWGTHTVLDDSPWKGGPPRDDDDPGERPTSRPGEWKWLVAQPDDWKPQVRLEPNRAIVTFYTYTALAKDGPNGEMERERVVRHTETYRRGKYRALVTEKKIAEGPDALAF